MSREVFLVVRFFEAIETGGIYMYHLLYSTEHYCMYSSHAILCAATAIASKTEVGGWPGGLNGWTGNNLAQQFHLKGAFHLKAHLKAR